MERAIASLDGVIEWRRCVNVRRWLKSTSNRTFIVWPLVLLAAEALLQQGAPAIHWWGLPLLAWGYLQYRLVLTTSKPTVTPTLFSIDFSWN